MNRGNAQIKRLTPSRFLKCGVVKVLAAAASACLLCSATAMADDDDHPFLPTQVRAVSTVPANGDGNPYGVAFVPPGFPAGGTINPGDIQAAPLNELWAIRQSHFAPAV